MVMNKKKTIIDAGVGHINIYFFDTQNKKTENVLITGNDDLRILFQKYDIFEKIKDTDVFITGKLANIVKKIVKKGNIILPVAALWEAGKKLMHQNENKDIEELAIIDLSASGYLLIGIDKKGNLKNDTLITNPHCGAGSGVNLDRVLQKLAIKRDGVDKLLSQYLGKNNKEEREKINIRADRCGVFSSSATISDKNQGIPLSFALATTIKSEVIKTCTKLPERFEKVYLTGRVFNWQFARECAQDYLKKKGTKIIELDKDNDLSITGTLELSKKVKNENFNNGETELKKEEKLEEFPSFKSIKNKHEKSNLYKRLESEHISELQADKFETTPVYLGLDVGSTMAKLVICDQNENILLIDSYGNSGDTIDTVKSIFNSLKNKNVHKLQILNIGITGSARYQVEQSITQIYPQLKDKVSVLVENYAHARGSIDYARNHIKTLKEKGIKDINNKFCILVDIGGEDTKLSTITLEKGELFDNVMNVKCSAGTGSLMDTLTSLFGMDNVEEACNLAFNAEKSYAINATCAVFLMENARKLQAQGYPKNEILASANWAIVENMARSLWGQIDLPKNAITLLHGQTMLSEPLPLAVCNRLQEFTNSKNYCLVPPYPGHRACIGLIKSLSKDNTNETKEIILQSFIEKKFSKKVIVCNGVACGDRNARCNRTLLSCTNDNNEKFSFTLGGCTAVNELLNKKVKPNKKPIDSYKELWNFIDSHHPTTEDKNRLIIPRSFAVSEWAYFLSQIFEDIGIKTHVDNVQEKDILNAQPLFNIDTCAPHIGAVGQYRRLANEPHGMILAPQITFLPTNKKSLGRTCTLNQGGIATAKNLATLKNKNSKFHLFSMNLSELDSKKISNNIFHQLKPVLNYYKKNISRKSFEKSVTNALKLNDKLKNAVADKAAIFAEKALADNKQIALVVGREYILNPGIYDSHAGRLLRDKGMLVLPSYVFDVELDDDFKHIYWKNPHTITSIVKYVSQNNLSKKIKNLKLKKVFEKIESNNNNQYPIVQVSTFRCGPDSATSHLISEITKKRPFLLIQSDAIIKELAHLENRVNTHIKQIEQDLHSKLLDEENEDFEIKILENFQNTQDIDKETDVIYFPTLGDNRTISSVVRSIGFTCIDNFNDESYNLSDLIKEGRKYAGDSICAPLAAVFGDTIRAVEDFKKRKDNNDPLFINKKRVLVFNNKGTGPCRQGQYSEVHKLLAHQKYSNSEDQNLLKFLVSDERKGYNFGVDKAILIRAFKGGILQGVLHQILFNFGSSCNNLKEYKVFKEEFKYLKKKIFKIQENTKPNEKFLEKTNLIQKIPLINEIIKYYGYGLNNKNIEKELSKFTDKWKRQIRIKTKDIIKIHIEGEAYLRIAQSEEVFNNLLSTLGFNKFNLEYTPVWSYLEYILLNQINIEKEKISNDKTFKNIFNSSKKIMKLNLAHFFIRNILAKPLYKAVKIKVPESMKKILELSKKIIPTLQPAGELTPYVGEAIHKLENDTDLLLNIAPEGCMVSSMGEVLTPKILNYTKNKGGIQNLFSQDGEINDEILTTALLKILGPEKFYKK